MYEKLDVGITLVYKVHIQLVDISAAATQYVYRDGYVGMVLCYHCHLVCVLCRPCSAIPIS